MQAILSVLFPRTCPVCQTLLKKDEYICPDCLSQLPRTEQAELRGNITEEAFYDVKRFVRGAAFLHYKHDSPVAQLLLKAKFGISANPGILTQLTHEATIELLQTDFLDGIDVIIPLPLHPRRLRQRGFNQAEYIARELSRLSGIPLDTSHLTRTINNEHQARMKKAEREDNVANIFHVNHPEELAHQHILLIDDIITTGNTMRSCMTAMKPIRGAHYSVFALAKAR